MEDYNKEYFAEYIPVEGEIKAGGKHVCLSNGIICDTTEENDFYVNNENHKRVKLFLCSRDIQVDDEITHIQTGLKTKKQLGKSLSGEWVKVIGEISPEAKWVKDGDRFSGDQVEKWWWNSFIKNNPTVRYDAFPDYLEKRFPKPTNATILCKIKGQCGHFH